MSIQRKSDDTTNSIVDSSSTNKKSLDILTTIELNQVQQNTDNFEIGKQSLFEECVSLKKQCDELTKQKQATEIRYHMLLDESHRTIEEKDTELKRLRETTNIIVSNKTRTDFLHNNQPDVNEFVKYQKMLNELQDENIHLKNEVFSLKTILESKENIEKNYQEQIHRLQLRITELEDWNGDNQNNESSETIKTKNTDYSDLHSNIDLLTSRNRQLENDLQRLQSQQRNNQLALERLDEYEETISQLQEQLNQFNSNKKKQHIGADEDINRVLMEERKRYNAIFDILEETRLQLKNESKQSEEKILQIETNLKEKFEQEKINLENQIQIKDKQIEIGRNERETLQKEINNLQQLKDDQEQENRLKEIYVREMLERQIIELNEQVQSLENDKNELNHQIDELRQQLQSKDQLIQNFQTFATTPGAPPMINVSSNIRDLSPSPQASSNHLHELEGQIYQNEKQFCQINSIYNQFLTLLPCEYTSPNETHVSLSDRFVNLFEQFSTYIGTFSIIQEELDSLKQILNERQDELEKLRAHLELTTDKLTQLQEEKSLLNKNKSYESDEDELEEILGFQQRAPSRQSLLSITPGEKQQLIAQNELLSSLLIEKERELISLQQAEKSNEDLIKNLEILRLNLQQMEHDKDIKQIELNDIRNVLDEKLRENSSLKKEKMYFIEKLAEFERERNEQQSIIQMSYKQSSQDREISSTSIITKVQEQITDKNISEEQNENLYFNSNQLLKLSKCQQDESISYYHEYMRILTLYNDLNIKYSQLEIDYKSIQSLIQQKNEAFLQCQNELNTYQNLLYHQKKKSDDIDLLRSTLNEREIKIQQLISNENQLLIKQSELESNNKLLEENNFKLKSNQQLFEQMQLDLKRITHERDLAIIEKKQIENQIKSHREKLLQYEEHEQKLTNEVERLCQIEKSLRNQLEQLDNSNREKTEFIHHFTTNNEQSQQELLSKLEMLKHENAEINEFNTNLTQQLKYQIKCSQNLQNSLDQFQQEREQHMNEHLYQYQDSLREQISISARLTNENNELHQRLEEYNEIFSSVNRLNDEMKTKDLLINKLQTEIDHNNEQILAYNENFQTTNDTRVEKQLVKNILLSYFHTPIDKQQEVIPILSALVGFTQEEYQKVMNAISNNCNNSTSTSWLTGWLSTNSSKPKLQSNISYDQSNKSFTELLIQYVDQQSVDTFPQPTSNINTNECNNHQNSNNSIVPTSDNSTHFPCDKQLVTVGSTTSNIEQDINIHNQSSLPTPSTIVDGLLTV
ncbi:unnamed protein product [Rotaria sp. Silwood1]|nr:unnamed protein product [Rotaria sp. Silwood1]